MHAALAQVKEELGPEAVILNTKTFHQKGFLGFGRKEFVEILASNTVNIASPPQRPGRGQAVYANHHVGSGDPAEAKDDAEGGVQTKVRVRPAPTQARSGEILREISSLKTQVEQLTKEFSQDPQYPPALDVHYKSLVEAGVSKALAREIIGAAHTELAKDDFDDEDVVMEKLQEKLGKLIKLSGPIKLNGSGARTIALIGPTGVGKTTTIAKLAAHYSIKEKRSVALITADTYRIAAVEQLKTYADIIGVTLDVALTPSELRRAVRNHSDKDIIFVDTAGRSQLNQTRLVELKSFIEAAEPDENHLLISATTDRQEVFNIIEKFGCINVSSFIFSKVDECAAPGIIFNVLSASEKPISYITTGQDVPDDIEVASEERLLDLLYRKNER
jgi:flagellar biosynthesis protein FlhF